MSKERNLNLFDRLLVQADTALRTLAGQSTPIERASPSHEYADIELTDSESKHVAGLMRINHAGEVCAQALYQGQALTAKLPEVREAMEHAANEEVDHLAWCEERIHELDSKTSLLNPLWYGLSFSVGAAAGIAGDKWSLGFVAATEEQVCKHLDEHLSEVPHDDLKTRAILEQMKQDEMEHATRALESGGANFPMPVKNLMTLVSKVMTKATYKI